MDKNLQLFGLTLYLKKQNTLILSDIHLGYEEALNKKGVLVPRLILKDIIQRLEKIFLQLNGKPSRIIITGDLKHEFGEINQQEWREILRFLDFLSKNTPEIIILQGNHDKILLPVSRKRNIQLKKSILLDNYFILHGDVVPEIPEKAKTIIIGHEHCAVALRTKTRVERYKAFITGKIKLAGKKYNLFALPSLNTLTEGTDILNEPLLSPFLQNDLSNFSVFVVGGKNYDEIMEFGKVKQLRKMMSK